MTTNEMNIKNGYIRLPHDLMPRLQAVGSLDAVGLFVWLVQRATRHETTYDGVELERGQLFVRKNHLAEYTGMSYGKMRRMLAALSAAELLTLTPTHTSAVKGTIVTICEYDQYSGQNLCEEEGADSVRGSVRGSVFGSVLKEEGIKENRTKEDGKKESASSSSISEKNDKVLDVQLLESWMMRQTAWTTAYETNHGMTEQELRTAIRQFVAHLQDCGVTDKPLHDAMRHFSNWHQLRAASAQRAEEKERRQRDEAAQREQQRKAEAAEADERYRRQCEAEERAAYLRIRREMEEAAARGDANAIRALGCTGPQDIMRRFASQS